MPQAAARIAFRHPVKPEGWARVYCLPKRDESPGDRPTRLYTLQLKHARYNHNHCPGRKSLADSLGQSTATAEHRSAGLRRYGPLTHQQRTAPKRVTAYGVREGKRDGGQRDRGYAGVGDADYPVTSGNWRLTLRQMYCRLTVTIQPKID